MINKPKVDIQQRILAHYRKPIFSLLHNNFDVTFYTGNGIKNDPPEIEVSYFKVKYLRNYYFRIFKKNFYIQTGLITKIRNNIPKVLITGAEPYNITSWILPLVCKILKIKCILWTNSNDINESGIKLFFRKLQWWGYDAYILYSSSASSWFKKNGCKSESIFVINNSLDFDNQRLIQSEINNSNLILIKKELRIADDDKLIIHIGRINKAKRLEQLIESTTLILKTHRNLKLLIIGDGPEKKKIEDLIKLKNINHNVLMIGEIYNEIKLAQLIKISDIGVFPGNGGLAVIHCLTYGTPVLVHNNLSGTQTPEAESVVQDLTGGIFQENDIQDMSRLTKDFLFPESKKQFLSKNCMEMISKYYTPQFQLKQISAAIDYVLK